MCGWTHFSPSFGLLFVCVHVCLWVSVCMLNVGVYTFAIVTKTHRVSGSSPAAQTATWPRYQRWWFWRKEIDGRRNEKRQKFFFFFKHGNIKGEAFFSFLTLNNSTFYKWKMMSIILGGKMNLRQCCQQLTAIAKALLHRCRPTVHCIVTAETLNNRTKLANIMNHPLGWYEH